MDKQEFHKGDYVRIVLEGRLTAVGPYWCELSDHSISADSDDFVSMEVIQPPVVTFKAGDVVRDRFRPELFTLGLEGYLDHQSGEWKPINQPTLALFTSEYYEKVELVDD